MKHENLSRARNQHKISLHYIKSTHQLSFRNINLKWTTIQWAIGPQYRKGIVAKPGTSLLIIHSLTCQSDIKEVHGNLSRPFFERKVHGQKDHKEADKSRDSIPYIIHAILSKYCQQHSLISQDPFNLKAYGIMHRTCILQL